MASLKWEIRTGHSEERTLKGRPKGPKGPSVTGNSQCKGPEAGRSLVCVRRNRKEARQGLRGRGVSGRR